MKKRHEINARKGEGPTNIPKVPIKKMNNIDKDGFEDKSDRKSSKVWAHFLLNSTDSLAKCMYCSVVLKMHGTKSLHVHLEKKHSILTLSKLNEESKEEDFEEIESSQIDSEMPDVSEINQDHLLPANPENEPVYIEHGTGKEIKEEDIVFEDISKNEETRSKLWDHYLYSKIYQKAKCTHCSRLMAVSESSTKSLHAHLKSLHQIVVPRVRISQRMSWKQLAIFFFSFLADMPNCRCLKIVLIFRSKYFWHKIPLCWHFTKNKGALWEG